MCRKTLTINEENVMNETRHFQQLGAKRKNSPPRAHDDMDFLEPSTNSIALAKHIDQEMRRKVQSNPRLIY